MSTYDDARTVLSDFNCDFPRFGLDSLELSDLYDLTVNWPQTWPSANLAGVYLFFDENQNLLYIGKASCHETIGSRLGKYFQYGPIREAFPKCEKSLGVRFIATIGIPCDRAFEAPAVEEFLIWKLRPPSNRLGL